MYQGREDKGEEIKMVSTFAIETDDSTGMESGEPYLDRKKSRDISKLTRDEHIRR